MDARKTVDFKKNHFDRARKDDRACIQISSSVVGYAKVHHEVGNGPKSPTNLNVNYEVWIVTSRVVNWKGEPF